MAASRKNTKIFLLDDSAPSTSALDRLLQKTGQPFEIIRFPRCTDLISCIEKLKREELPTSFILDSYGEDGLRAAKLLIQHYQDCSAPLPFICFTSSFSDVSSGVCQKLLGEQPNLRVNFTEISPSTKEVELISALLEQQTLRILPCCYGLREFLNLEFGLNLSLDVDDSLHAREYRDLRLGRDQTPTTLPQLLQWLHQQHNLPTQALYPVSNRDFSADFLKNNGARPLPFPPLCFSERVTRSTFIARLEDLPMDLLRFPWKTLSRTRQNPFWSCLITQAVEFYPVISITLRESL
jgi:hypothetical protein